MIWLLTGCRRCLKVTLQQQQKIVWKLGCNSNLIFDCTGSYSWDGILEKECHQILHCAQMCLCYWNYNKTMWKLNNVANITNLIFDRFLMVEYLIWKLSINIVSCLSILHICYLRVNWCRSENIMEKIRSSFKRVGVIKFTCLVLMYT